MTSFWNLILEPGKKYEKMVENGIHVSQAVLDTSKASATDDLVQVVLEYEGRDMTIANLSMKRGIFQSPLDLAFSSGDNIAFTSTGAKVPVTLTGIAGDLGDDDSDSDEFEGCAEDTSYGLDESDEEPDLIPVGGKRKLKESDHQSSKVRKMEKEHRMMHTLQGESFVSEDESDDDNYNPLADPDLSQDGELKEDLEHPDDEEDSSDEEDLSDDDDEEVSESDDESDEDVVIPVPAKLQHAKMNGHSAKKVESVVKAQVMKVSTPKQTKIEVVKAQSGQGSTPKQLKADKLKTVGKSTPAKDLKTPSKDNKTPKKEGKTPKDGKSPKAQQEVVTASPGGNKENVDKTPKQKKKKNKDGKKTDTPIGKSKDGSQKTPNKPQMRNGGVLVEDMTVGGGAEAKSGNTISMFYEGRLSTNGKVFDKKLDGAPFKFRLGRGEVIKGWDIGVAGMKIGGKRKITVPAQMGYGREGAMPQIPPNSSLSFVVTMLNCR